MNLFNQVKKQRVRKSKFNLSHERKMSLSFNNLYPIMVQPILPGDNFNVKSEVYMRFAPLLAPIMHRVNVYTHYFFVPNRIIWNEWEDFITGGKDGNKAPIHPQVIMNNSRYSLKTLADYLGLPTWTSSTENFNVSALPFRAYQQIYNDFFRDQNLIDEIPFSKASGVIADGTELDRICTLRKRAWPKDYFTSCLPWAQRGPEAEIQGNVNYKYPAQAIGSDDLPVVDGTLQSVSGDISSTGQPLGAKIDNIESLGITINELRTSVRLQEWLENNARGGARYVEQLLSHFGVIADDARLQRAEWLGGGKTPVSISEVLQTSATSDEPTPQGTMAGHGISVGTQNGFRRRFKEHGYVIGVMSVLPTASYQQGVPRHFKRFDKLEYPWPEFANLGEQEVKNHEVYLDLNATDNDATFGYQSRYAEEKFTPSTVHGDFKTNLDYWHMGRKFTARPNLNQSFVESDATKRIFAVEAGQEDELYCQLYHNVSAVRPLPYFGTPRL